ncbi:MAG: type IV pilin-like G/H family protein [Roseofilum sp. SID2]|uniref:type IV pilin-like G/H family protein n=1 Tax=Roseofilum sp. SID2 TaxID=2821498 RepID=UPI001B28019B|nr:type IV pilin-like G/H family protein [Roseofilum sp. SID2]MBP0025404.1 type IV pilin-like G/H family protein [Roseofilum sp. SID2]
MKTEFRTKFLQHLIQKKEDEGFTLIELLVVIIIIGILSAIALPSFLNQANKAKQSEAKQYVGSMNRQQQAYYLEKGGFSFDLGTLGLGIEEETENYIYGISTTTTTQANITANSTVTNFGDGKPTTLKSYVGGVAAVNLIATSESTTLASLCEADDAGTQPRVLTFIVTAAPTCPTDYTDL